MTETFNDKNKTWLQKSCIITTTVQQCHLKCSLHSMVQLHSLLLLQLDRKRITVHCVQCVWGETKNPPTTHPHTLSYCADKPFTVHLFMIIH